MLILIIKLLICFVLFQSAWHKILNPGHVINAFIQYEICSIHIPKKHMQAFGIAELCLLVLWHVPVLNDVISLSIFILFSVYTLLLFFVYSKGRRGIACGCSGPAMHIEVGKAVIVRNLIYLSMILSISLRWESHNAWYFLMALPISLSMFLLHNTYEQLSSNHALILKIEKFS